MFDILGLIISNNYKIILLFINRAKINFFNTIKVFFIVLKIKFKNKFWKNNKAILFPCETSIESCLINLPLYLAVYKAGYNLEIYMSLRSFVMIPFYLILGVSKFHFLITLSKSKLRTNKYKLEFDFEKYTIPSLMRNYRIGSIKDFKDFDRKKEILDLKIENLLNNFSKTNLNNVKAIFFSDYVYVPQGPLLDYIFTYHKKIDILSFNVGHIADSLIVNKLENHTKNRHAYAPPFHIFISRKKGITKKESLQLVSNIRVQLKNLYENKEWFNYVGTSQYQKYFNSKGVFEIKKEGRSRASNTFAIFPHIYWDASNAAGDDLFNDYKDWFEKTVFYILENTKSDIIVKDHPSNIYKLKSLGMNYKSPIKSFLLTQKEDYQKRLIYLKPDTKISTISVIEKSDYVLTVRGTVGVEASLFGKNVIFAGSGRFNEYGFGIFPNNINEYFCLIKKASNYHFKINEESILNAALYLDILWNQMTFFPSTVKSFRSDDKSSFLKNITSTNIKEISTDIDHISKWIKSPTATYLKKKK